MTRPRVGPAGPRPPPAARPGKIEWYDIHIRAGDRGGYHSTRSSPGERPDAGPEPPPGRRPAHLARAKLPVVLHGLAGRSEERRVGKECRAGVRADAERHRVGDR